MVDRGVSSNQCAFCGKQKATFICEDCARLAVETFDDRDAPLDKPLEGRLGVLEPEVRRDPKL